MPKYKEEPFAHFLISELNDRLIDTPAELVDDERTRLMLAEVLLRATIEALPENDSRKIQLCRIHTLRRLPDVPGNPSAFRYLGGILRHFGLTLGGS